MSIPPETPVIHLRRAGTSVVIDLESAAPVVTYWGPDLGEPSIEELRGLVRAGLPQRVSGALDDTARRSVTAAPAQGWLYTPSLAGHRDGTEASLDATLTGHRLEADALTLNLRDTERQLAVEVELHLGAAGLLHQRLRVRNDGESPYTLTEALLAFPVPWDATELLDTTGRHLRERAPQRHPLPVGVYQRESRRGRPGADASLLLAAGRPGFGFERGRVYGIHVAWSGNHRMLAERVVSGEAALLGGELLLPGEVRLVPGEEYLSPWVIGSWGEGLDALAHRFHDEQRRPRRPRPLTLNSWEAVYFDHSLDRLVPLVDAAADVGLERFVLDDGWFLGRRDDTAGLGDWVVDPAVWPEGLGPLISHVHSRGMEFGLWVEPEMINPDSKLAREHPDWILRSRQTLPPQSRHQQVLDLSNPAAYAHIRDRLLALLAEYDIAYLKWDHNRDLVDAGSGPGSGARVRRQTLAVYALLDELRAAHPELEIESCASGGARVDLGILARTDRIWTSDCLDPLERLANQRYTGLVVPPELMGMHLTSPVVHSTGRTVGLDLSGAVALFGHHGIEWDLTTIDDDTRESIRAWVRRAKDLRELIATGRTVNVDLADAEVDVRGMVAADGSRAVFTITQAATGAAYPTAPVRFPGLDADRRYRVRVERPARGWHPAQSDLAWQDGILATGRMLAEAGVRPPLLDPAHAVIVTIDAAPVGAA